MTAVDTSALISIYKGEANGASWLNLLEIQRNLGRLIACDVIVAELAALFATEKEVFQFLDDLGVEYDPVRPDTAILTGQIFKAYRKAGGPREHLIPDFLIGAHAMRQARQLAAADQGYLRRYFPKLKVIAPKNV